MEGTERLPERGLHLKLPANAESAERLPEHSLHLQTSCSELGEHFSTDLFLRLASFYFFPTFPYYRCLPFVHFLKELHDRTLTALVLRVMQKGWGRILPWETGSVLLFQILELRSWYTSQEDPTQ